MNTPSHDPRQLNAFVDGELDLAAQLELEARLKEDAALRAQVERLRSLRDAVRGRADYHAAPDALRQRIGALVAAQTAAQGTARAPADSSARSPASDTASGLQAVLARWFAWRPLVPALGLAAAAIFATNLVLLPAREDSRIEQEVIASHVRATLTQRMIDVESSDHHTVKPWLSSRLDFSPPVYEPADRASALLGGRVDYIDGRAVATMVYRHQGHIVESYVWPASKAQAPVKFAEERGFHLAHWSRGGMAHWVISDLNPVEFSALVGELSASD
jgi:anti-sigma factor RsiW